MYLPHKFPFFPLTNALLISTISYSLSLFQLLLMTLPRPLKLTHNPTQTQDPFHTPYLNQLYTIRYPYPIPLPLPILTNPYLYPTTNTLSLIPLIVALYPHTLIPTIPQCPLPQVHYYPCLKPLPMASTKKDQLTTLIITILDTIYPDSLP